MKKFLTAVIFMLGILSSSCGAEPVVNVESARNLSTSVDALSWKYFATLDGNRNIFYSPYGINAALSILANGASGETRREILFALEVDDLTNLNAEHKNFSEHVAKNYRGENIFKECNLLLVDKKFIGRGLDKNFQRVVSDVYKSDVREANFSGDCEGEREKITRWVAGKTAGFIPNYKSIATQNTITDLLNIVYFKGKWKFPFKTRNTIQEDFTNRDGSKAIVDMMSGTFNDRIVYRADDKFKGIVLPYGENSAMYVIMPVDDNALNVAELWNEETFDYRTKFLDALKNSYVFDGKVVVHLPKFELDIENNLVENLKTIGLEKSFTDFAEYFNIVKDTSLKIGNANHRAKVKVDETGTEAAAVTEITLLETTATPNPQPPRIVYFYADKPFLFMIRDVKSNVTLFAGVLNKF